MVKARKRMKHEVLYHTTAFLHSFLHVSHCCVHLEEVFNKLPATCQLQAAAIGMMSQASKLRSSCNWQVSGEEGRQHSQ